MKHFLKIPFPSSPATSYSLYESAQPSHLVNKLLYEAVNFITKLRKVLDQLGILDNRVQCTKTGSGIDNKTYYELCQE